MCSIRVRGQCRRSAATLRSLCVISIAKHFPRSEAPPSRAPRRPRALTLALALALESVGIQNPA